VLNPQAVLTAAAISALISQINSRWSIFWMGIEAG